MHEEQKTLSPEELSALLPEGYALVEKDSWIPVSRQKRKSDPCPLIGMWIWS